MPARVVLRSAGVALLISAGQDGMPEVVHWGTDLGEVTEAEFEALRLGSAWMVPGNSVDLNPRLGIIPEGRYGWTGTPGLIGSCAGRGWSPGWRIREVRVSGRSVDDFIVAGPAVVEYGLEAVSASLWMLLVVEMLPTGLVRVRATLENVGDAPFEVTELTLRMPVPGQARDLMDFGGRWAAERMPQRTRLDMGVRRREGRHGRTGADAAFVLSLGEEGFGYQTGEIWACHVAWSGNHLHLAERDFTGAQLIGGGELLLPGEGWLTAGRRYRSPWVYFNHAVGLDAQAERFHQHLRALPLHPDSERPVSLNVWEAVYFDHDVARLIDLAERAAALGVERYVLDDGWFGARRDDHAGLGDWVVSPEVWPEGLHPLVNRVTELGMQFGLWFEPEMVNPDSDVARAHPEWLMQLEDRLPLEGRFQQVLNLSLPGAFDHVLGQMSAILEEYPISYVKWDHNRDLNDAGTVPDGRPAVAAQTRAFYALLDELRRRFPQVEFESCSSGGSRIDLEVMERAERVWVSDNIDPDDRQRMLWWTSQLLPAELLGSHIASGRSHVTGRWHDLSHRAATAVFGHLGIEWDLASATEEELEELAWWIAWYKDHRKRLLAGRLVRVSMPDPGVWFKGIVNDEGGIYSLSVLEATPAVNLGMLKFPGLISERRYRVEIIDRPALKGVLQVPWMAGAPLELTGAQLMGAGLRAPVLRPSTTVLFVVTRI